MKKIVLVFSILLLISGCDYQIIKVSDANKSENEKLEIQNRLTELEAKMSEENYELAQKNEALLELTNELKSQLDIVLTEKESLSKEIITPQKDLFTLKQECASAQESIIADINAENLVYRKGDPVLEEVFYSPKRESCMYVFRYWPMAEWCDDNKNSMSLDDQIKYCFMKNKIITDFFTKEVVTERDNVGARVCVEDYSSECDTIYDKNERFDELLESLK